MNKSRFQRILDAFSFPLHVLKPVAEKIRSTLYSQRSQHFLQSDHSSILRRRRQPSKHHGSRLNVHRKIPFGFALCSRSSRSWVS
jgi:hypothetical protein